jgi:hypothetical protein
MPKQAETPAPITLTCNTILDGRFIVAGEPLPCASEADVPETLRAYIVTDSTEAEEPDGPRGAFELNTLYQVTSDGRLGRRLQREVAQMEAENAREEWIEEEASRPLPQEIVADLEDEHHKHVSLQAAQLGAAQVMSDSVADAAQEAAEPPVLLVRRGVRHYARALSARLKPGEPVFIKEPDGSFQFIGTTDSKAQLPDLPVIIT